ncbi:NADH dehydrogenase [ubiquinone] iron-sulfur protein 5-like [Mercenaria mercenaria]|uniref:NADH dehydrogenase [ubiquinone] iron-sulfur protein 5-like n=1 Tax=Mercenaria mercenaria TaxID=6596 RepID=UPI00234EE6A9|nr:NADH dehydrogenase [ubiquinone] iron-sulfur protein 5-like [Mercenaria mercenaria]XP_053393896.1 NADH dehydrogenase [ubiquinone] iron-sulfur protein 5-like [Mercenaria mercenaria]XP_053393897.1 NADH dehydrogenase [ubiquinone] iron-sulfur protein 5-like [Mercenaria mercenaria]
MTTTGGNWWDGWKIKSITRVNFIDFYTLSNMRCADMEMEFLKCADRVGLMYSKERCKDTFEDWKECTWQMKAKKRAQAIRREKVLQNRPDMKDARDDMRVDS